MEGLTDKQARIFRRWLHKRSVRCRETSDTCGDPVRAAKLEGLAEGFEEILKVLLLGPDFIEELDDTKK